MDRMIVYAQDGKRRVSIFAGTTRKEIKSNIDKLRMSGKEVVEVQKPLTCKACGGTGFIWVADKKSRDEKAVW